MKFAKTVRSHWMIMISSKHRLRMVFLKVLISKIQLAKRRARGYRPGVQY